MRRLACIFFLSAAACSVRESPAATGVDASTTAALGVEMTPRAKAASNAPSSLDPAFCTALCARSAALHCPAAASCIDACQRMRALPGCEAPVRGALDCFMAAPTNAWTCNAHGLPSIQVGLCDAEQSRAAKCLGTLPPPQTK